MKHYRTLFLLIVLIFSTYLSRGQHAGTIQSFTILPQYLNSEGRVMLDRSGTTSIKFRLTFARHFETVSPTFVWKPFNMTVALTTSASNGRDIHTLSQPVKITNLDFIGNMTFLEKEFDAMIDNSKITTSNPLVAGYIINDTSFPILSFNGKTYFTVPPVAKTYYNIAMTKVFYRNNCSAGYTSDPYTFNVEAGRFSSTTQAGADALAQTYLNTNGQLAANINLECKPACSSPPSAPSILSVIDNSKGVLLVNVSTDPSVISYRWYIDGTLLRTTTVGNTGVSLPCGRAATLEVEAVNACGYSIKASTTVIGCQTAVIRR